MNTENGNGKDARGNHNAVLFTFGCASLMVPPLPIFLFPAAILLFLFGKEGKQKSDALWLMIGSATAIGLVGLAMSNRILDFGQ